MLKSIKRVYVFLIIASVLLLGGTLLQSQNTTQQAGDVSSMPTITPFQLSPTVQDVVKSETVQGSVFYPVIKVVDGDTVTVTMNGKNETLRLIGINTPETVDPRRPVECFGREASDIAKSMLTGKMIRLESDETQTNRDKYDRLLRYVFLEDGTNFNKWMISEGYAYEYTYDVPYIYQAEFKAAQQQAQAQQKGLWNPNVCGTNPQQPAESSDVPQNNPEQPPSQNSMTAGDKDCPDFKSQQEAQEFFLSQGGPANDPHKLDADKDGVVCESLP